MAHKAHISHCIQVSPKAKLMLAGALVFGAIDTMLLPVPYLMAWLMLEHLTGSGVWPMALTMNQLFFWVVVAMAARWLAGLCSTTLSHCSAMQVTTDLRTRLLEHLGRLPMHWHAGQTKGGIKKVFTSDIGEIEGFLAHHIPDTVSALLLPILSLVCLVWVNWMLGLLLVLLFAACLLVQAASLAEMSKNSIMGRSNRALEDLNSAVVEFVRGMPVIKLFNRELSSFSKMRRCVDEFRDIQTQGAATFAPRWALFSTLTVMPFTLAAVAGAPLYLAGQATLSEVTLFLMLGCVCLTPLTRLVRLAAIVSELTQSLNRLRVLFAEPVEKTGTFSASCVRTPRVEVRNLCVRFGDKTILDNISFVAEPGTTTAIVGASGSGKSTLAATLAGLEQIHSGTVSLDGYPLSAFPVSELARLITPVFQAPHIFAGTIASNIALGVSDPAQEDLARAARLARCDQFIEALPSKYETRIGEGGDVHLSGGQKQRLALARMAFRKTPIVVLDEATSYADAESEAEIQAALSGLLKGCTVLVVAHRLHTIAKAQQILVLREGEIVERGTHESLLAAHGVYAALWAAHHKARSWSIRTRRKADAQTRDTKTGVHEKTGKDAVEKEAAKTEACPC